MQTLICTGNGGLGSAMVAATTASAAAQAGYKTLLSSIGPSHSIGALLGTDLTSRPQTVAPNLDAFMTDAAEDLGGMLEQTRSRLFGKLMQLSGDELPLFQGIDFFLCLERLRQTTSAGYDLSVVDAGPHDTLLRVLALPDSFRWGVRLMLGLDRGAGQSTNSVARAMIPTSLLPYEWISGVQEARVQFEHVRNKAIQAQTTSVRYVLRPDNAALHEARLAVPALHLHGLAVDAIVVGPLIPADISDARLAPVIAQQQAVTSEAAEVWNELPVLRLPIGAQEATVEQLAALGSAVYGGRRPEEVIPPPAEPINYGSPDEPAVIIRLPGIRREALALTVSGDELIVRVGPYRRHILLPDAMRGKGNIRANREGERLIVRLR